MSIDAAKLRHRVTIQSQSNTQDPQTGEMVQQWHDLTAVWAAIEPLSGREFIAAAATQSEIVARIVIRHRNDVTPMMRLKHSRYGVADEIYNIHGVLPDKDSGIDYLTMPVSLGVNDG